MSKIVTFGEIMLRLKSPGNERFFQSPMLEATFGGGEANVAVGLARYGLDASFVTLIPKNQIGAACIEELRKHGVDTTKIIRKGDRMGIYFLEAGANQRPSQVVYDRAHSSISEAKAGDIDWSSIFASASWFHIAGITPAISASAAELSLESVKVAKDMGLTVSCDLNYRKKLWKYGKEAPEVMSELVRYVDVVIGNEDDCQKSFGIKVDVDVEGGNLEIDKYKILTDRVMEKYPNIKKMAITMRESRSANDNGWSAVLNSGSDFIVSKKYEIKNIIDRVGGGDSFASGLIYGLNTYSDNGEVLNFAVAASCLKHSILGDLPLLTVGEVLSLSGGDASGRGQR